MSKLRQWYPHVLHARPWNQTREWARSIVRRFSSGNEMADVVSFIHISRRFKWFSRITPKVIHDEIASSAIADNYWSNYQNGRQSTEHGKVGRKFPWHLGLSRSTDRTSIPKFLKSVSNDRPCRSGNIIDCRVSEIVYGKRVLGLKDASRRRHTWLNVLESNVNDGIISFVREPWRLSKPSTKEKSYSVFNKAFAVD